MDAQDLLKLFKAPSKVTNNKREDAGSSVRSADVAANAPPAYGKPEIGDINPFVNPGTPDGYTLVILQNGGLTTLQTQEHGSIQGYFSLDPVPAGPAVASAGGSATGLPGIIDKTFSQGIDTKSGPWVSEAFKRAK